MADDEISTFTVFSLFKLACDESQIQNYNSNDVSLVTCDTCPIDIQSCC